jgi:DNA-binding SARP family transcriptional activator
LLDGDEEDWILAERERFQSMWMHGSCELMRAQARLKHYETAAATARHVLMADVLREGVHHDLMLLLTLLGQRGEALRQYERCRSIFAAELGIAPLSSTRALCEMIRDGSIADNCEALAQRAFFRQL